MNPTASALMALVILLMAGGMQSQAFSAELHRFKQDRFAVSCHNSLNWEERQAPSLDSLKGYGPGLIESQSQSQPQSVVVVHDISAKESLALGTPLVAVKSPVAVKPVAKTLAAKKTVAQKKTPAKTMTLALKVKAPVKPVLGEEEAITLFTTPEEQAPVAVPVQVTRVSTAAIKKFPQAAVAMVSPAGGSYMTEEEEEQRITERLVAITNGKVEGDAGSKKPGDFRLAMGNIRGVNRGFSPMMGGKIPMLSIPVQSAYVSSRFGWRNGRPHEGVDLAAPMGTTIYASADGVVSHAGWYGGYGNMILIDHGDGLRTLYGHCSKVLVTSGQVVKQGETIGKVGNTGHSTGPHLHYEVLTNGVPQNPERFLFR